MSVPVMVVLTAVWVAGAARLPEPAPTVSGPTLARVDPQTPRARRRLGADPVAFVSGSRMIATLEQLTEIGRDGLYRTSASAGEGAAFDVVEAHLEGLKHLATLGLETARQPFRTGIGQEVHEASLFLTVGGVEIELPAHAIQGHRDDLVRARRFDSDGSLNDLDPDPVEVFGAPLLVDSSAQLAAPSLATARGRLVLLDYALVDRALLGNDTAIARAEALLGAGPTGVVLVTTFSDRAGDSHGSFVGDLGAFTLASGGTPAPTIFARIEDLGAAGISEWSDLADVTAARIRWDSDVLAPGHSHFLTATIPGVDRTSSILLGAHLDSPNSPGALDDGSGSVTLLEVARALDDALYRPPVDVVLTWFGSHERGVFGSTEFYAARSELLDRALAMLQIDCLSATLDGLDPHLFLETWTFGRLGDPRPMFPEFLSTAVQPLGIDVEPLSYYGLVSDNSSSTTFGVPNANLIYFDPLTEVEVHYGGHLHDPYDTADLARREITTLTAMARTAVRSVVELGRVRPTLRVTPAPQYRAVLVASHTEAPHMAGPSFIDFGTALAWEGYDLDVIPYGTPVTAEDLAGADLVVALPIHDYPTAAGDLEVYDEAWTTAEIDVLDAYADAGGLLVLTNARHRMKYLNYLYEENEDWVDARALGARFGVDWHDVALTASSAARVTSHTLLQGIASLALAPGNGTVFAAPAAQVLARADGQAAVALIAHGAGEVLVVADLGIIGSPPGSAPNLTFFRNLARYARNR